MLHRSSAINCHAWAMLKLGACVVIMVMLLGFLAQRVLGSESDEVEIAVSLAKLLQAGRSVISSNQALINDPSKGDKGLTGNVVLAARRAARLCGRDLGAIREVVEGELGDAGDRGRIELAWLLARYDRMLLIPGTVSVAHLEENMAATQIPLDKDDLEALEAVESRGDPLASRRP